MSRSPAPLTAVIVHWRNWPAVCSTIDAVLSNGIAPADVVVVDNASGDGSATAIRAAYPSVRVIEMARNGGYATGMNAGIRAAVHDDLLLLTDDCVLAGDAAARLVQRLHSSPDIGAVGPLLGRLSAPDSVWSAGGSYRPPRDWAHRATGEPLARHQGSEPVDVPWIDGACLCVRRSVLDEVGGFDEGYFLYFEETELLFRARARGWRVVCDPSAVAWQEPGARPTALYVRNHVRFLWRNVGRATAARQVLHQLRRVARLLLSRDADSRWRGRLELRGVIAVAFPNSPAHKGAASCTGHARGSRPSVPGTDWATTASRYHHQEE